jgi:hypothetical protein
VPISAHRQNSSNETYIQSSINDWNLHLPENYVNRRVQEVSAHALIYLEMPAPGILVYLNGDLGTSNVLVQREME